jgi:cytoskeletal protein CcmA (bactofilin family)
MFTKKPESEVRSPSGSGAPQGTPNSGSAPYQPRSAPASSAAGRPTPAGASGKPIPSTIGGDLTVTGNLSSRGEIVVDGTIQGDITCAHLTVGESANITGAIIADEVIVRGQVMGSIRGLRVVLQANSRVEGDIYHQTMSIEQGALFEGRSRRSEDPLNATAKSAAAAGLTPNLK